MSDIEIKKTNTKSAIIVLLISVPVIIISGIIIYSIAIHPLIQRSMSIEQLLCDRLGAWKEGDESGVTTVRKTGSSGAYELWYNFSPVGIRDADDELAVTVAKDLLRTFTDRDELNQLSVTVCMPYRDAYLKRVWKPYISFELNRETLAKYSYEDFYSSDLYIVADNIKRYEK